MVDSVQFVWFIQLDRILYIILIKTWSCYFWRLRTDESKSTSRNFNCQNYFSMAQLLKCISFVFTDVTTTHGQVQFKILKTKGEFLEDVSGLSYKCKTITFSETSIVECSAKCYDPKSVKWRDSEFNCKTDSDPEMSLSGLYCKYFTFTRGQCSLCLRSNGFDPTSVQIPSDDDYIGLNTGMFLFVVKL